MEVSEMKSLSLLSSPLSMILSKNPFNKTLFTIIST